MRFVAAAECELHGVRGVLRDEAVVAVMVVTDGKMDGKEGGA